MGLQKRSGRARKDGGGSVHCDAADAGEGEVAAKRIPGVPRSALGSHLEELFKKKGSIREDALTSIIQTFKRRIEHEFVENNFATLLYRFLNCAKNGSSKEVALASHAIGLLAMTTKCRDKAHELYGESVSLFSKALKPQSKKYYYEMVNSLVVVTYFCADASVETEKSMQILWDFIHQQGGTNISEDADAMSILVAAISAWSCLLSTLDGWRVDSKQWKGAIPYFLSLLKTNNIEALQLVACEALFLILEIGYLRKFSDETEACDDIAKLVRSTVCSINPTFIKYSADKFPKKSIAVGRQRVILSTWSELIQLNFLKLFLGQDGFITHMLGNKLLRDVFEFNNQESPSDARLYIPEREERMNKSANSAKNKARTQLLNKNRAFSEERRTGHFISED
ncbi:uncharacterized protein LOC115692717 isoform X2 [Syzygium oleosum]|uniref:uncharacterized protein LOC115692717 isoform X2 n=1 Tax=Syzygium oleosum TaxID=219896 RepID=UPI0024BB2F7B|nr:uncharacterized protein LOC115692717 isoform X2 [Syzygium oleosum]